MNPHKLLGMVLALGLLHTSAAAAAEFVEKKFVFTRKDTQQHFWLNAGGTFIGSQIFQYWGLSRRPATGLSALGMLGVWTAKEFAIDDNPSVNDLIADGLGIALGSLAALTIHFDYARSKENPSFSSLPWNSRLSLVERS